MTVTVDTMIARRVRRGANEADSRVLLAELLATSGPGTLSSVLVYQDFATPAQAERFATTQSTEETR